MDLDALHQWGRDHRGSLLLFLMGLAILEAIIGAYIIKAKDEIREVPCANMPDIHGPCVPLPAWVNRTPGRPYFINETSGMEYFTPRIHWSRWFPWVVNS
jgi:hypothetical protein